MRPGFSIAKKKEKRTGTRRDTNLEAKKGNWVQKDTTAESTSNEIAKQYGLSLSQEEEEATCNHV